MNGLPATAALPLGIPRDPGERVAALFDAHYGRLYRLARRLSPTAEDALDLVQETFLRAVRSPGSVPAGAAGEEAWLVRVLINISRDGWRKHAVRTRHLDEPVRTVEDGREDALIAGMTVWRALQQIEPRRRAIVVLHKLEGLPVRAIAPLLGITAVTVRWHLSIARRQLGRILAPESRRRA